MEKFLEFLRRLEPLSNLIVVVASAVGILLAYQIGLQQNDINYKAVQLENFVELFVYPAQNNLNVVNVGTRPVYLISYDLNGKQESMGGGALPNVGEHWYAIPVPPAVQTSGTMDLVITYQDYLGQTYISRHHGVLQPAGWKLESQKSEGL